MTWIKSCLPLNGLWQMIEKKTRETVKSPDKRLQSNAAIRTSDHDVMKTDIRYKWPVWTAVDSLRLKKIVRLFKNTGTTSIDSAKTIEELDCPQCRPFYRLVKVGGLIRTGDGRYYLDEIIASQFMQDTKRRIQSRALILLVCFAVFLLIYLKVS